LNLDFHFKDICILKAIFFCILRFLWTYFFTLEHEFSLGGGCGQRGHHIRYAPSKASVLYLILGLNFFDIYLLKALYFCILCSLWTYFFTLEHEVWLGGGWPPRWPRRPLNKDWIQCARFQSLI
jgi:hypothetical protein